MPDMAYGSSETREGDCCLNISLQSLASHIRASDGRDTPFARAILTIRNMCAAEVVNVMPHATLGQEGGTVQDVTSSLSQSAPLSIPAGEAVTWDVYDLLIPAHPGAASKIHMFGYRAALNWRFDLTVRAEYQSALSSVSGRTPVLRWTLLWSVENPSTGEVTLTIEDLKD